MLREQKSAFVTTREITEILFWFDAKRMNDSIQEFWQNEKRTRRKIVMRVLLIALIALFLFLISAFWITQPLFSTSQSSSNISVNPYKLQTHVEKISNEFYPRNCNSIVNLNKTADYIKTEFEKSGGKVSVQTFQAKGNDYQNIIVIFGDEASERIVIGGHYDSAFETHGADDNASGVAGLIELAYLLGQNKPTKQVELVAYTLEEPPFFATEQMGSYIHAKSLKDNDVKVSLMISLEMIGYFSDEPNSQKFPLSFLSLFYPNRGNFAVIVGNFTNISTTRNLKFEMNGDVPVYSANVPTFVNGVDFSDHRNYWNFGYDAVMITDTAFYRNFAYHAKDDTAEKLDYAKMAKIVEALINLSGCKID
jgi:Peptidase family M28